MAATETDALLVRQVRAGDAEAWRQLIERFEGRLLAFVDSRLRDRAASEDVVQETFIGFLTSLPHYDEKRDMEAYLFSITAHKLTDHLRKAGRHPLKSLSEGNEELLEQQSDHNPTASSRVRSDERQDLERAALTRCMGQILRGWQEKGDYLRLKVMELLWVKGWANRDVAAFLNISEQQVANYRFAAVKKLTELIRAAGLSADVFPELQEPPPE